VQRPDVVKRIESAKALGDLSENAEYHDAKDQLSLIDTRIAEVRDLLHDVTVVEKTEGTTIGLGSTVDVVIGGKLEKTFFIVGASEADPANGKISNESPIGKALFGHKKGDSVEVVTPAGVSVFVIKHVG